MFQKYRTLLNIINNEEIIFNFCDKNNFSIELDNIDKDLEDSNEELD